MPELRVLKPGPDCTIRTARSLQGEMIAALVDATALTLDCARIERADVSFVQLVLSAAESAKRHAKDFAVVNVSPAAEAAFGRSGVASNGATFS